ncbi:hypothetical protein [Desulfocurvus sp.]|jgi:hypothetical protein|uniref:hypothetical protein n=1 Tax=Desulfocurvus sp. TaxID=2871698 RepID=UPI0025C6649B|nr:hypothetical protein [Desulfocurvus sp.]MCK9240537.1 hypothetical protein [Desulfocurvus sp.]
MDDWKVVGTYPDYNDEAYHEFKRWSDVCEDIALYPEANVRVVKDGQGGVRVEISHALISYFEGTPGEF